MQRIFENVPTLMIDYLGYVVPMEPFETSKKDGLMSDDECCKILDIGKNYLYYERRGRGMGMGCLLDLLWILLFPIVVLFKLAKKSK